MIRQSGATLMFRGFTAFSFFLLLLADAPAQGIEGVQEEVAHYLRQEIDSGTVVGAQVLVGGPRLRDNQPINLGTIGPDDPRPVSDETLFCIASCSKPVASAVIFTLLDSRRMRLNQPVGELIAELSSPMLSDGQPARSPDLRELLSHRGGIYSQMQKPTADQLAAIRNFRLSLDESVAIIAKQPLAATPGTAYAYSGAGYCLVGAMAERATGKDFETLLQENLCRPLGMTSTTYFPTRRSFDEIAAGGKSHIQQPHLLGDELKLPLIGGSLYTTASDMERFARMVTFQGRGGGRPVLSRMAFRYFVSPVAPNQPYGYGWLLTKRAGHVVAVSHNGELPPFQSAIRINLQEKTYKIVFWTLAKPGDIERNSRVRNKIYSLLQ
ncbi:serine hydrolase domain-containing protein [Candidatus Laterigemmans baculatus]|uniref:serine hydrolase domain-containing protein n=1 Tax=Candidatus Laterigemmans baculatus TaxID=2770505 RepID=UPI0013DC8A92|nr:serine hydrolase domain-containing protein [Candidatus Laterigemmans baculatus]